MAENAMNVAQGGHHLKLGNGPGWVAGFRAGSDDGIQLQEWMRFILTYASRRFDFYSKSNSEPSR